MRTKTTNTNTFYVQQKQDENALCLWSFLFSQKFLCRLQLLSLKLAYGILKLTLLKAYHYSYFIDEETKDIRHTKWHNHHVFYVLLFMPFSFNFLLIMILS